MAISKKLLNEDEKVLLTMRQHPKALFPALFWLVVLLAVGVISTRLIDVTAIDWAIWILVALGIVWLTVRPVLLWATAQHAITDRRIITRWGIITRRGHDIPLRRVSDISIEINLIDRPFGCGTLIITNASTNGNVHLHDIPHVEQTKLLIHNLINGVPDETPRFDEGA